MNAPRSIITEGYAKLAIPASFGKVPRLEWLSISQLVVDPEYQREISNVGRKNIRRIAENFNWSMFGTVMVAAIGGSRFAIVDGQHRTTAAALCGIQKVPCQIVEALLGEQAAAFRAINANTTRPHPVQLFHAAVAAGDSDVLRIVDVCKKACISIPRHLTGCGDYQTYSIETIRSGITRYGAAAQTFALRMIVHSRGGRAEDLTRAIIKAVTEVLGIHKSWRKDEEKLKAIFLELDLEKMCQHAAAKASMERGSSAAQVLEARLREILLKKLGAPA